MDKYDLIIFDTNNLYYKNFETHQNLTINLNGTSIQTGGIYGTVKSVMSIKNKYLQDGGQLIYTFDNHISKENLRKEIDPSYKSNRLEKSKRFYKGVDYLEKILKHLYDKSLIIRINYLEADDLIPAIIKKYYQLYKYDKILLVSEDSDWCRNLSLYNNIYQLKNHKIYNHILFKEEKGFDCSQMIFYKMFRGDYSDNIPNAVPFFPEKILLQILNSSDKIQDVWDFFYKYDKGYFSYLPRDSKWGQELNKTEIRERLIKNYRLINFIDIDPTELGNGTYTCKFNKNNLRLLYASLGFNIDQMDQRLKLKKTNFF